MGLLGLFASIITGGILVSESLSNANTNSERKSKAIRDGDDTWTNVKGREFYIKTGEEVFRHNGKLIALKSGRVIKDYIQEGAREVNKKRYDEAKEKKEKYMMKYYPEFHKRNYYVELSTMKRYYLSAIWNGSYHSCYKIYYEDGEELSGFFPDATRKIKITEEEFKELGGMILHGADFETGRYYIS